MNPNDVFSPSGSILYDIYTESFKAHRKSVLEWVQTRRNALKNYFQRNVRFELRGSYYWGLNHTLSDVNVHITPSDYDGVLLYYRRSLTHKDIKIELSTTNEDWRVIAITGGKLSVRIIAIPKHIDSLQLSVISSKIIEKFETDSDRYNYQIDVMLAKLEQNLPEELKLKKWLYIE